jgi:hypothetical protein
LAKQARTDGFTCVDGHGGIPAAGMAQTVMAALNAD